MWPKLQQIKISEQCMFYWAAWVFWFVNKVISQWHWLRMSPLSELQRDCLKWDQCPDIMMLWRGKQGHCHTFVASATVHWHLLVKNVHCKSIIYNVQLSMLISYIFPCRNFCFVYKFVEVRVKKEQVVIFTSVFLLKAQSVIVFQEVINCLYCGKICIWRTPLMTPETRFSCLQLNS